MVTERRRRFEHIVHILCGPTVQDLRALGAERGTSRVAVHPIKPHPGGSGEQGGSRMKHILGYLEDEQGIETLEWLAVGALIIAVALVVYPGTLQTGLITVVNKITDKLTGIVS